jgi:hypothetical protein
VRFFCLQIKTTIFMLLAAAEDEETQRRGMVGIFYFTAAYGLAKEMYQRDTRMFDWVPVRMAGGHFCFDDSRLLLVKALVMLDIGRERRVRVRFHEGASRVSNQIVCDKEILDLISSL